MFCVLHLYNIPPCPLLRLEGVIRGREKFQANSHAGGLTNAEKERKKNYLMIRKGKAVKNKTRMGEKQVGCTKFACKLRAILGAIMRGGCAG